MTPTDQRPPFQVEWDESAWEKKLWRSHETCRPVLDLIDDVTRAYGRQDHVAENVPLGTDLQFRLQCGGDGRLSIEAQHSDRRVVVLAHRVHRAIRALVREDSARLVRQVDVPDESGSLRRTIVVRRDVQRVSVAIQIKRLHRALQSGSRYKIEAAWFGLTERAHEYLSVSYHVACRRGAFAGFRGEIETPATIIPVPMLAPDLLTVILPYAVRAVSYPGKRPEHPRDEALAEILRVFQEVSGLETLAARRGDHHEPAGPGADFVPQIEAIFDVRLMAKASTHAMTRARRRMAGRPGRSATK
jgi:hypothetical protein